MSPDPADWAADRLLAHRILRGDERAFEELFEATARGLARFARGRLGDDPEAVREVVQATYCKAVESLGGYRGEGPLAAWLQGICRFEASAWRRRGARVTHLELDDEAEPALAVLAAAAHEEPEDAFTRRRLAGCVHEILDALPPPYGDVLEWKYLEGWTVNEIATHLRRTPKAAEMLLLRARDAFRERFLTAPARRWAGPRSAR